MPKSQFVNESGRLHSSQVSQNLKDMKSISVPFPPKVNPIDLVKPRKDGKPRKRCANYFLIYRIQFAEALRANGCTTPLMTDISTMAGDAWKEEPEFVRQYYKDVANEVKKLHDDFVRNSEEPKSLEVPNNDIENSEEVSHLQVNAMPNFMQMQQSYVIPHDIMNVPGYGYQQLNLINGNIYSNYNDTFFQSVDGSCFELVPESNNCYEYFYKY
ncbi:17848_t:CDS:1 [Funneliformis geosporum]|uniref:8016_t:CDS:1 n=1 Tax=Funneliformis geosporum TaxID=1117311 RepID=A0A9W4SPE4_9GLOM|nr:8016_t:CDS:1 [Funneliformis geosporum]CAI2184876.1 17848_t:CDS:1 [Funneliformis geosporum]